jgi:hypothetical protein
VAIRRVVLANYLNHHVSPLLSRTLPVSRMRPIGAGAAALRQKAAPAPF